MSDADALLRKPWSDIGRQRENATFGIWVFLASEVLFFGALFLTYAVNRFDHPVAFAAAARETNVLFGTANTASALQVGSITIPQTINNAAIGQSATSGNTSSIGQAGFTNTAVTAQIGGVSNTAAITQFGAGNTSTVHQVRP